MRSEAPYRGHQSLTRRYEKRGLISYQPPLIVISLSPSCGWCCGTSYCGLCGREVAGTERMVCGVTVGCDSLQSLG
jgi:hypothetical protein